ncbi:MAG: hypothetical protein R3B45_03195 [Bdellovibrionota bacterium]
MKNFQIEKYLNYYAEPEAFIFNNVVKEGLRGCLSSTWDRVVSVPICAEFENIVKLLEGFCRSAEHARAKILVLLVLNHRKTADQKTKEDNHKTWHFFSNKSSKCSQVYRSESARFLLTEWKVGVDVLIVDKFSDGSELHVKQGVGLARKIGADIATMLCAYRLVHFPIIFNTDGDAQVGRDYFSLKEFDVFPGEADTYLNDFFHETPADMPFFQRKAIQVYESYMATYVHGLEEAGSPYAYHSLGSIIATHVSAYVSVRGFPKRQAGEDFYLLNKLAKVGKIHRRSLSEPIILQARISRRVPFGTGPAIEKISSLLENGDDISSYQYDKRLFAALKSWLFAAYSFLQKHGDFKTVFLAQLDFFGLLPFESALLKYLTDSGAIDALARADRCSECRIRAVKNFNDWFDAFRTMKLVHHVRSHIL